MIGQIQFTGEAVSHRTRLRDFVTMARGKVCTCRYLFPLFISICEVEFAVILTHPRGGRYYFNNLGILNRRTEILPASCLLITVTVIGFRIEFYSSHIVGILRRLFNEERTIRLAIYRLHNGAVTQISSSIERCFCRCA